MKHWMLPCLLVATALGACDRIKTTEETRVVPNPPAKSAMESAKDTASSVGEAIRKEAAETSKDVREDSKDAVNATADKSKELADKTKDAVNK